MRERRARWFPTGVTQHPTFPRDNISLKIHFSNCHQTLKRIAMGSPLGAAFYISFLQGDARLKILGTTCLAATNDIFYSGQLQHERERPDMEQNIYAQWQGPKKRARVNNLVKWDRWWWHKHTKQACVLRYRS